MPASSAARCSTAEVALRTKLIGATPERAQIYVGDPIASLYASW
jgi:hypothetical protein